MVNKIELSLGEALVKQGVISQSNLQEALQQHTQIGEPLIVTLVRLKLAKEDKILQIISAQLKIPLVKLGKISIDKALIRKIPVKFVAHYKFMPVKVENNILTTAVFSPLDLRIRDEIRLNLGYTVEQVLATREEVTDAIKKYYGLAADTIEKIMTQSSRTGISLEIPAEKIEDIEKLADDASVIKLVNQIILEGHKSRATDIHLEPYRGRIRLRYRVDGILYDANVPSAIRNFFPAILSRIKIMANLNIVERRLPQDGRCVVKTGKETLDMRISIIPTPHGESVVIRILPLGLLFSLENLGLGKQDLEIFEKLLKIPHGIIFVSGPTGSGKTTTLYTALQKINTPEVKIITIEDPVEYELEGITQIHVAPEIDLTFARGLRSVLRHDPDVIMLGEVRDFETAEVTIRVALTGHLVFSTLHTNDAAGGVTRLIDMGIEPYLVASSVEAFIAQRLVRLICSECKQKDSDTLKEQRSQIANWLGLKSAKELTIYKGKGCDICNFTGYRGRTAIYEILLMDDVIRELVLHKTPSDEIKKLAVRTGMKTLRRDGWKKIIAGLTTPEEVMRVTPAEGYTPASTIAEKAESGNPHNKSNDSKLTRTAATGVDLDISDHEPKRVYHRVRTRVPMIYALYKKSLEGKEETFPEPVDTIAIDISASGISFETKQPLSIGNIIKLIIKLPLPYKQIECLMRAVRVEEVAGAERYRIGSCFLDIASEDKAILDKFVAGEEKTITHRME